ncbi:MAG: SusC/RagA family TonB-linked outer membrane protein [Reichenbachiella sp.]|uniref:SusC/RagA family TonB-linked outer membrane protein n=1 Tax=Reichenbachiella sp. TaxID=2184521 RepID=UPI00326505EA
MKRQYTIKFYQIIALVAVILLHVSPALSQSRVIKGTVTDDKGITLPGVTILIVEGGAGTVTDIDGAFTLDIGSETKYLKFSYVGFLTQDIEIGNKQVIQVSLKPDVEVLDDVVVTALGISREKESLGYAVTEVDGKELAQIKTINPVNALSGKVAGVDISQPNTGAGGSSKVIIRGNSKITGTNQPLYVIDGVPMDNGGFGEAGEYGGIDQGDGISSVNPDDIESISVLKGPAAAALYGSRAGNGVIMITTKKWSKNGGNNFNIDFSSYFTAEQVIGQYSDTQKIYGQGINTPPRDQGEATGMYSWGQKLNPDLSFVQFDGQLRDYGIKEDNIKSFFQTGTTINNTIAFSGGNEFANFRFSGSDMRMEDIVPNSGLVRNTFSLRGNMKMWKKFSVDTKITYTKEQVNNRPYLGFSGANSALPLMQLPLNIDQNWLNESKVDQNGDYLYWHNDSRIINPYYAMYNMENESDKNRVMGYLSLTYDFNDWLNLRVKGGGDTYSYKYYNYAPYSTPLQESGEMSEINSRTTETNAEFLLTARKEFGNFDGSISLGGNSRHYDVSTVTTNGRGQVSKGIISINNYGDYSLNKTNPRGEINSFYAFANVGYKNFAFLDVTARQDWDSTLPQDNNSVLYPSITGSFVFTSAFDIQSGLLSYGKVRGSYAEVGNGTDPYGLDRSYYPYPYTLDGATFSTESGSIIPNPDLVASLTKGYEFGLEAKLFNYRVGLDITYYNQTTFNEIVNLPVSLASGGKAYKLINAGEINNNGWEVMLNIEPIKSRNFLWDMTLNWAKNRNSIVKLHPDASTQEIARASWINSLIRAEEGGAYGDIVGFDFKRSPSGEPIVDDNGLPIVGDEQVVLGNGQYDWTGGFTNKFTYKGIGLKAHIDMKYGADLLSMTNMKLYQYGRHINTIDGREGWHQSEDERLAANVPLDQWTPTNGFLADGVIEEVAVDENGTPVLDEDGNQTFTYRANDKYSNPVDYYGRLANSSILSPFIYDASYIKLREVSLSYSFPKELMKSTGFITSATISFVARNVWTIWSNVPNIDPESTYTISNGQGYEYASLPQRRSLGFNLNIKF